MKRSQATAIKSAPGKCKLRVIETETRDCICSDTGSDFTTLAYVAIGAEAWGSLFAAAPDLASELAALVARCDGAEGVQADGSNMDTRGAHAALSKAGL